MAKAKVKPSPRQVNELMAEKSAVLSKAQALMALGLPETAQPL